MKGFIYTYRLHLLLFWALLFAAWYFLRADDFASSRTAFTVTLIKVADLALMVCICNYILIPRFFYRKRYFLFVLLFVLMIIASSLIKMQLLGRVMNNAFLLDWSAGWRQKIYDNIIPHFFLVTAGAAIKLMIDSIALQKRMSVIAKEKAEAELNFLKQQINPHFLFNALNNVYFQIDKKNTEARESLHTFSEMLRYQLYEAKDGQIAIEKEIQYLKDYIRMQRIRKDERYHIHFSTGENVRGFRIEPFLLLPFVENCFKHVSHFIEKENNIDISLSMEGAHFVFHAENSFETTAASGQKGIGLENVQRRLALLYPGRYSLQAAATGNNFVVQLKLHTDGK
ncbi:MAG: histidine kinase [Ferruginibacter sp.]